jgi:hypothetical protein
MQNDYIEFLRGIGVSNAGDGYQILQSIVIIGKMLRKCIV